MRILKATIPLFCLALLVFLPARSSRADEWNKKTIFTFSAPVEIPGYKTPIVLPAGTYVFKLLDSLSDRNIVQVFNKDENHLYATILAIPDYRMQPTDKPLITFTERAAGSPEAIKAWFYPGDNYGQEFVYPKVRAVQLAQNTTEPVLSMSNESAANIVKPVKSSNEASVKAMEQTPVMAEKPGGGEEEVSQAVETQPPSGSTANQGTQVAENTLPKTASDLPLLGLCGMLLACFGVGLRLVIKRHV